MSEIEIDDPRLPAVIDLAGYPVPVEPEHDDDGCPGCHVCAPVEIERATVQEWLIAPEAAERYLDEKWPDWKTAAFPPPARRTPEGFAVSVVDLDRWIKRYRQQPDEDDEAEAITL